MLFLITYRSSPITCLMQPEIFRRCKECGAVIRSRANFCPQCGKPLGNAPGEGAAIGAENVTALESEARPNVQSIPPARPLEEAVPDVARHQESVPVNVAPVRHEPVVVSPEVANDDGARTRLHRARTAARDAVEERLGPRVEKIRQASTGVIDEAAEDPGLRFVLIAAALFVFSLILLLVSHLIR